MYEHILLQLKIEKYVLWFGNMSSLNTGVTNVFQLKGFYSEMLAPDVLPLRKFA